MYVPYLDYASCTIHLNCANDQTSQEIIVVSEISFSPSKEGVLSKAVLNAAKHLGLSHAELAKLLGTNEVSVSQLVVSNRSLDPSGHEGARALMLVQIFIALHDLVGGDADACVIWMNAHNQAIGDLPKQAIQTLSGLEHTQAYLHSLVPRVAQEKASRLQ